jgi:stage V sporulation protein D (sporulation-specific penicillin-binding protein)
MIGGKTGTAETLPRGNNQYVVSFMGYAPADDPQIAIYVVVDRPNVQYQDDAKHATRIVRKVLTEVLPYMNIFMTEELSDSEREELEALQIQIRTPETVEDETEGTQEGESEEGTEETGEEGEQTEEDKQNTEIWKTFPIDPESGYAKDPSTGYLYDPDTGTLISGGSLLGEETDPTIETESENTTEDTQDEAE